jgi:hypothetical protein
MAQTKKGASAAPPKDRIDSKIAAVIKTMDAQSTHSGTTAIVFPSMNMLVILAQNKSGFLPG